MKASDYMTDYKGIVNTDPERIITVDFETYFCPPEYSLKKQSMEEYIRSPEFMVHGMGIKRGRGDTLWIGASNTMSAHDRIRWFFAHAHFHSSTFLAHNALFDGLILNEVYGVTPKAWIDTMSIATMLYGNAVKSVSLAHLASKFLPDMTKDSDPLMDVAGLRELTPGHLMPWVTTAAPTAT